MMEALDQLAMPTEMREAVREALERVVELAHPDLVILFGSWAEGRAQADSDVDLVVVAPSSDRRALARDLYLLWHRLHRASPRLPAADILVYTPREFQEAYLVGFPAYNAVRQGVVVHGQLPDFCLQVAA